MERKHEQNGNQVVRNLKKKKKHYHIYRKKVVVQFKYNQLGC